MTTKSNAPQNDPPCNTIAYRLALRSGWIDLDDPTKANAEAFARRRPKTNPSGESDPGDEDGLSLLDSFFWPDLMACVEDNSSSCYGVISLHVGTLRNYGLNVIRNPNDHKKLLVTNLPFENPETNEEMDLLQDVADSARIAMQYRYRRKKK